MFSKVDYTGEKIKDVNPLKHRRKRLNVWYLKERLFDRFIPQRVFMINMENENRIVSTFLIKPTRDSYFKYRGKTFIVDLELAYYNQSCKNWVLDYHENLSLPIKRHVNIEQVRKNIKATKKYNIQIMLNPSQIEKFMRERVTEALMKSSKFLEVILKIKNYIIAILIITVIHLLLFFQVSGLLSNLSLPI